MTWRNREVQAEQLTDEWFKARMGCLTGSVVGDIMPGARGGYTKARETLLYKKVVEYLANVDESDPIPKRFSDWGHEYESEAIEQVEEIKDFHFVKAGLIKSDFSDLVATSVDAITEDGRMTTEVKCPYYMRSHLKHIKNNPAVNEKADKNYYWQIRMHMLVTGAEWCTWSSYHPLFEPRKSFIVMIQRDDAEMNLLKSECLKFIKEMKELAKEVIK